jgi:hypothetical protein
MKMRMTMTMKKHSNLPCPISPSVHLIKLEDIIEIVQCGCLLVEEIVDEMAVPVGIEEHGLHADSLIQIVLGLLDLAQFAQDGTAAAKIEGTRSGGDL